MPYSEKDYEQCIEQLLPRGPIWKRRHGSILDSLVFSFARELTRVDRKIDSILNESDPRTSLDMLSEWFIDWGIPSECLAALSDPTQEEMRQELITKITSNRSLTAQYFKDIAETLGYEAEIETYSAFTVASPANKKLFGTEWNTSYAMGIRVRSNASSKLFTTQWTADQSLAIWGDRLFECIMRTLVPAHVTAIFEYEGT